MKYLCYFAILAFSSSQSWAYYSCAKSTTAGYGSKCGCSSVKGGEVSTGAPDSNGGCESFCKKSCGSIKSSDGGLKKVGEILGGDK